MPEAFDNLIARAAEDIAAALLLTFAAIFALVLTIAAIDGEIRRRRLLKAHRDDELEVQRRRQQGIDEGFRQGWHG